MKKIVLPALALVLALSLLTACGGNPRGGDNDNGGNNSTNPPASQGGNDTASGENNNGGDSGGFKNLTGDPLTVAETAPTIEKAVGVSAEGTRIVRKYTDKFFDTVSKPDGCKVIYQIYEFDAETGEVSDSSLWYGGFTDGALFKAAFQKCLDQTYEKHIRGYNVGGGYYGYYTWAAIQDYDNDGTVTWADAVASGEYESDVNHILIN